MAVSQREDDAVRASILHALLEADSSVVNHQDHAGNSALHLAALNGLELCCVCLLQVSGCQILQNRDGKTPRSLAHSEGHTKVEQFLARSDLSE